MPDPGSHVIGQSAFAAVADAKTLFRCARERASALLLFLRRLFLLPLLDIFHQAIGEAQTD